MLENLLQPTLRDDPEKTIVESGGETWSVAQVEALTNGLANALMRRGLEPMDRVAMLLSNRVETIVSYLACFKSGLVVVPLDYRHSPPQINYAVNHSGASTIIVDEDRLSELQSENVLAGIDHVIVISQEEADGYLSFHELTTCSSEFQSTITHEPSDLCVMIYTSGTTSRPKGVTYTRGALEEGVRKYLARVPLKCDDVALIAAPMTRPMALRSQLLPVLWVGGMASLIPQFHVDAYVEALGNLPKKTFLALLPSALRKILSHAEIRKCDFEALRICMVGGDRASDELYQLASEVLGIQLTTQYGSSETGPIAINPPFGRKKPGSVGLPMYGAMVCIVDESGEHLPSGEVGNIVVHSDFTMEDYWNDTALTRKTIQRGAVQTGDLGKFDEDGFLWISGRKQDIIIRGGSNVSPAEVESVLLRHDAVRDASVVGVSDPTLGQEVCAFVTTHGDLAEEDLLQFATGFLADYMVPAKVYIIDELPLKGAGKIDRDRLRLRAEAGQPDL